MLDVQQTVGGSVHYIGKLLGLAGRYIAGEFYFILFFFSMPHIISRARSHVPGA